MCVVTTYEDTGEVLWLAGRTNILLPLPTEEMKERGSQPVTVKGLLARCVLNVNHTQTIQHKQGLHTGYGVVVHETSNYFRLKSPTSSQHKTAGGEISPFSKRRTQRTDIKLPTLLVTGRHINIEI